MNMINRKGGGKGSFSTIYKGYNKQGQKSIRYQRNVGIKTQQK